jgi:hypothetical protein
MASCSPTLQESFVTPSPTPPEAETRHKPDPYVAAGVEHLRRLGVPHHRIWAYRVGRDHAHVINCMFDDPRLNAIVVKGNRGYTATVITAAGERCPYCDPRPVDVPSFVEVREDLADHGHTVTLEHADAVRLSGHFIVPDGFCGLVVVERDRGREPWVSGAAGLDGLGVSYELLVKTARAVALDDDAEYVAADQ